MKIAAQCDKALSRAAFGGRFGPLPVDRPDPLGCKKADVSAAVWHRLIS